MDTKIFILLFQFLFKMELSNKKKWLLIISSVVILSITIFLVMYYFVLPSMENIKITQAKERFYGTWIANNKNVNLTFYENNSCLVYNDEETYFGSWKLIPQIGTAYLIEMNWEGFFAEYIPLFTNDNSLSLVGYSDGSGLLYLRKA